MEVSLDSKISGLMMLSDMLLIIETTGAGTIQLFTAVIVDAS
jgi:hypothetical protein